MPEDLRSGRDALSDTELLVFDLDGTLVDSRTDLAAAVNATLHHFGRAPIGEGAVAGFIGDGAALLVSRALEASGDCGPALLAEALPVFFDRYRFHETDHTLPYPGVPEALAAIRSAHPERRMAVLTNKPVGPSRRICQKLHLDAFFAANFGGDSFPTKKPEPEGLLHLAKVLECRIDRTVMIGDSAVDIRTARHAGALSIGCGWGYQRKAMVAAGPDAVAERAWDWLHLLGA